MRTPSIPEARHELELAIAATQRCALTAAAAQSALAEIEAEDRAAVDRHAIRVENWVRAGSAGLPPSLVADDRREQARRTAQVSAMAAGKALEALQAAEGASRRTLAAAEAKAAAARDAAKQAECDRLARRLNELRAEERALAARLTTVDLDSGGGVLSPLALEALSDPPGRPTPQSIFGRGILSDVNSAIGGDTAAIADARAFWVAFEFEHNDAAPAQVAA